MDLFKVNGERFNLGIPITKYNEATGEFEGLMAVDELDKSKEIIDLDGSRPHFDEWQASFAKATDGQSFGNVREQHDPRKAAGKLIAPLTEVTIEGGKRAWKVTGVAVDPVTKQKLADRVLVALSIGGGYEKKTPADDVAKGAIRYIAKPSEVSLVDNPCMPSALITVVKADGTEEVQKAVGYNPLQGFQCRTGGFHARKDDARKCEDDHGEMAKVTADGGKQGILEKCLSCVAQLAYATQTIDAIAEGVHCPTCNAYGCGCRSCQGPHCGCCYSCSMAMGADEPMTDATRGMIEDAASRLYDALVQCAQDCRDEDAAEDDELMGAMKSIDALTASLRSTATLTKLSKSLHVHTGNGSKAITKTAEEVHMEKQKEEVKPDVKAEAATKVPELATKATGADGELSKAATDQIAKAVSDGLTKALEPVNSKVAEIEKTVAEAKTENDKLHKAVDTLTKAVSAMAGQPAAPRGVKTVTKSDDSAAKPAEDKPEAKKAETPDELMKAAMANPKPVAFGSGIVRD